MNGILPLIVLLLTCFSCNIKSKNSHEEMSKDTLLLQKVYPFFHQKFLVFSSVKPLEKDARNTVSSLALTIYEDIKEYSFLHFIPQGMMSITVAEFKEKDTTFSTESHLKELIEINENNEAFTIDFENPQTINNNLLTGYSTKGRTYVSMKENSYLYLAVLSDSKTMMSVVAVYENQSDVIRIENIIGSIKPNK